MHAFKKIKDEVEFNLGTKKKQMTLDAYFVKELNLETRSCQEQTLQYYKLFMFFFSINNL